MSARIVRIGKRNSAFQQLQSLLTNRQKRHATRTFLVEGVRPINAAVAHGWRFAAAVYEGGRRLSPWAAGVVTASAAPVCYELAGELLGELSGKDDASELLALLEVPPDDLGRIPINPDLLVAVIDRPSSPGNLGTLIRSCDAFGAHGLIVSGHAADVYDPATITASRGSLFALPVVRVSSPAHVATWLARVRTRLPACMAVGADERAEAELFDQEFAQPTVALFGNEAQGLSQAYRELCDRLVRIPMVGSASSLNVGIAGSIVFYEVLRQRHRALTGASSSAIATS